jgi:hypothetical protein
MVTVQFWTGVETPVEGPALPFAGGVDCGDDPLVP